MTENEFNTIPINFETKCTDDNFCDSEVQEELRKILTESKLPSEFLGDFL